MRIPFILEKALSLYADKEAVVFGKKRFTYRQFADRIYRLANYLKKIGISQGDRVAILHHNSNEFLECYFAVAELGAILNPLNFRLSPEELAYILKDSGATLLVAADRFSSQVSSLLKQDTNLKTVLCTGTSDWSIPLESMDYEDVLASGGPVEGSHTDVYRAFHVRAECPSPR